MTSSLCPVCSEPLSGPNVATCHVCGRDFHLMMRTDVEGKDCGAVWINEEWLYLEFACRNCLEGVTAQDSAAEAASPAQRPRRRRYRRRF